MKTQNQKVKSNSKSKTKTDWGDVANWYDDIIKNDDSYQAKIILPNLVRTLGREKNLKDKNILDLACGSGYFSNILSTAGASVTGVDLGSDLIKVAKENFEKMNADSKASGNVKYFVGNAETFTSITDIKKLKFDWIICILAIQNIEKVDLVLKECKKVLNQNGKIVFVINHPSFRIPKYSDWTQQKNKETKEEVSARYVEKYMSEIKTEIDMNPGERYYKNKNFTISFHRPLQYYAKLFANNGFVISKIEEWISHKKSEEGSKRKKRRR